MIKESQFLIWSQPLTRYVLISSFLAVFTLLPSSSNASDWWEHRRFEKGKEDSPPLQRSLHTVDNRKGEEMVEAEKVEIQSSPSLPIEVLFSGLSLQNNIVGQCQKEIKKNNWTLDTILNEQDAQPISKDITLEYIQILEKENNLSSGTLSYLLELAVDKVFKKEDKSELERVGTWIQKIQLNLASLFTTSQNIYLREVMTGGQRDEGFIMCYTEALRTLKRNLTLFQLVLNKIMYTLNKLTPEEDAVLAQRIQ